MAEDKDFDLDEALNTSLAELEAKESGEEVKAETTEDADQVGDEKAEDPKDKAEAGADDGDSGEDITDQGTNAEDEPADPQPLDPPARWSAEDKTAFAALPREAQEVVLKRERDRDAEFTRKSQEYAEKDRRWQGVEAVLGPRRQTFAMEGLNEEQALGQLFAISDFATKDPASFIRWFAQQRQVDLSTLTPQAADEYIDPAVRSLQQQVQTLTSTLTSQEQARAQQAQAQAMAEIEAFKNDPSHPHFESVKEHMGALYAGGKATSLQDAYDQAVWANAETRALLIEEQQREAQVKAEKDRKERAEKAKKAAGVNIKSKPADAKATPPKDWRDTVDQVANELAGA